ncbi:MAG: DUF2950 family protein [Acidobacteria bacterium]|nr:DUF2950 family protein [Acidobacteriota bacterium]
MRSWSIFFVVLMVFGAIGCQRTPSTPFETFRTYTKAIKAKDTKAMRVLLSNATLKMYEQEAKEQRSTVDEVMKRQTLFGENQTSVDYRNEKIDGDKATLEVKDTYGTWQTVPFVKEDGDWKLDMAGMRDQMIQYGEESDKKIDDLINGGSPRP